MRAACSRCGSACEPEDLPAVGQACVATQVEYTRPGVVIPPPYQIVLVRVAGDVVVRAPSLEQRPWLAGETAYLTPLTLRPEADPGAEAEADNPALIGVQASRTP